MSLHWRPCTEKRPDGTEVQSRCALRSFCGRYRVCFVSVDGEIWYEAWHHGSGTLIATRPDNSSAWAREQCAMHAANTEQPHSGQEATCSSAHIG